MPKDDVIEFEGTVVDVMPNTQFMVQLDGQNGKEGPKVHATVAGKMRQHNIRILQGDKVTIEMTPYDLTRGRITFRKKENPPNMPPPGPHQRRR